MKTEPLSEVAPAKSSDLHLGPDQVVWHLGLDQIESDSGVISNRVFEVASKAGSSTLVFDERNVLYSKLRPYLNKVVCPDSIGVATTELVPLRPDPKRLDKHYLCYYLRSPRFVSWISNKVSGAKMPRAKMDAFWQHKIPLPSLEDQKRIAYLLSKVEGLIAQRKQHLQQLENLLKSVFLDMFGDPKSNPKRFEVRRLSEFYHNGNAGVKCGPFGSALRKSEYTNSGVPIWNMDNISLTGEMIMPFRMWVSNDKSQDLAAYSVDDHDIIISRAGTVGKMCVARTNGNPSLISTNLIRLRLNSNLLHPEYFVALMTKFKGRVGRLKTGPDGAFTHMNTGVLNKLEFPYPPIDIQNEYVQFLHSIGEVKTSYERSLEELVALYAVTSQQAFAGSLDLTRVFVSETYLDVDNVDDSTEVIEMTDNDPKFELPKPSNVKKLNTSQGRKTAVKSWLIAYSKHLGDQPFDADSFLGLVKQKLSDLESDTDIEWYTHEIGIEEYDDMKKWIFDEIENKRLRQHYDDESNRVRVSAAKD